MAKRIYVGVADKARKVAKAYVGVNGVARKIKKAYIGIGGVARPCFSGDTPVYYGPITPLRYAALNMVAASNDAYAIFVIASTSDTFDKSLVRTAGPDPYEGVSRAIARVGSYIICAGGSQSKNMLRTVEAYLEDKTKVMVASLSYGRNQLTGVSSNNYALFGGGNGNYSSMLARSEVDAYDSSLTKHAVEPLSVARYRVSTAFNGTYSIFAGGFGAYDSTTRSSHYATVDAYDRGLTKVASVPSLTVARDKIASACVGSRALFCGGNNSNFNPSAVAEAFNANLTISLMPPLSVARHSMMSATLGDAAIFANGQLADYNTASYDAANVTDAYTESLSRYALPSLSPRTEGAAATIGNFALFAGGAYNGNVSTVEAYALT